MSGVGPLARAAVVLLGAAVSSFAPEDACPGGAADATRAARVLAMLAQTGDGARLEGTRAAPPRVCFVPGDGGLTAARVALLDRHATPAAQAARLGHLWQHAIDGAPTAAPLPGEPCDAWRARAADAEARGDAVELRVARALGAPEPAERTARDDAYASRCAKKPQPR